jgi:tetratricopeptide (TPR) repeat protein
LVSYIQKTLTVSAIINKIVEDLRAWNANRKAGPDRQSENSIKMMSFTLLSYLLEKTGRYSEIPSIYDEFYPDTPIEKALFLKHHVSVAYIKMGQAQKAIDLMDDVVQRQPNPKSDSLILIAHANLAEGNYRELIELADQIAESDSIDRVQISALNFKHAAYVAMGNEVKIKETDKQLKDVYSTTSSVPIIHTLYSPVLAYID